MAQVTDATLHRSTRAVVGRYVGLLVLCALALGLLHAGYSDLKEGGVHWFNLDKEKNLPTWFSGLLFFLFGVAGLVAGDRELRINRQAPGTFRAPILWLGVALVGFYMSLDEVTILHENLFWREVRATTEQVSPAMVFVTQWQILFAPAILVVLCYMAIFFADRFRISKSARRWAVAGIACWMVALLLEGIRGTFKRMPDGWYSTQVLMEELLEMLGAIGLIAAIAYYVIDIALALDADRRQRLAASTRFLTPRALIAAGTVVVVLALSAGTIYMLAARQADAGDREPGLFRRLHREQAEAASTSAAQSRGPWFDALPEQHPLDPVLEAALTHRVSAALFGTEEDAAAHAPLIEDRQPRIVFLSISNGLTPAQVLLGRGQGLQAALEQALDGVRQVWNPQSRLRWAKVDIVDGVDARPRRGLVAPIELARGVQGIAFTAEGGLAMLPGEVLVHGLVNSDGELRPRRAGQYLAARDPEQGRRFLELMAAPQRVEYRRFTTRSLFLDGRRVVPLFRGHRMFGEISTAELMVAARGGGTYLTRAVDDAGRFAYEYRARTGEDRSSYNMLRHAGTLYAMLELHQVSPDADLLAAVERGLGYMVARVQPCLAAGAAGYRCLVDDDAVKLGGNALGAIALAKYSEVTGDERYRDVMVELVRWIQAVQLPDGRFGTHKQLHPSGEVTDFVSSYYPGEALLALARVYRRTGDESLLDTAEAGAAFRIARDDGTPTPRLQHDHWLLIALNDLYRLRPDPLYLDQARRVSEAILLAQNRVPEYPDWLGSYKRPPRSNPSAIRNEGLVATYWLEHDHGDPARAERLLEAIRLTARFQLQTQFRAESAIYLPDPQRAIGGFHGSLTNFRIRIDDVQHNISALLGTHGILQSAVD